MEYDDFFSSPPRNGINFWENRPLTLSEQTLNSIEKFKSLNRILHPMTSNKTLQNFTYKSQSSSTKFRASLQILEFSSRALLKNFWAVTEIIHGSFTNFGADYIKWTGLYQAIWDPIERGNNGRTVWLPYQPSHALPFRLEAKCFTCQKSIYMDEKREGQ